MIQTQSEVVAAQRAAILGPDNAPNLAEYVGQFLPTRYSDAWSADLPFMVEAIHSWGHVIASAAPRAGCSQLVETGEGYVIAYNGYVTRPATREREFR